MSSSIEGSALCNMAANGEIDEIRAALGRGWDINGTDALGNTPLNAAAAKGQEKTCLFLLENGADPDIYNHQTVYPLFNAAFKNLRKVVQKLHEKKANMFVVDSQANNALVFAALGNHPKMCRDLIALDVDPHAKNDIENRTALHYAAENGATAACKVFIEHGVNIHTHSSVGRSVTTEAARNGHHSTIKLLLRHHGKPRETVAHIVDPVLAGMHTRVALAFPQDTPINRVDCLRGNKIRNIILDACVTGQFISHIFTPLTDSARPEDHALFKNIYAALPKCWQDEYKSLRAQAAKKQADIQSPDITPGNDGRQHG